MRFVIIVGVMVLGFTGPAASGQTANDGIIRWYSLSNVPGAGGPVKNAPYSANAVIETTQTLGDGNRIAQRTTQKLYRDSDGRERREEALLALGPLAFMGGVPVVTISDPVAQKAWTLDPKARSARVAPLESIYLGRVADALSGLVSIDVRTDWGARGQSSRAQKDDLGTKDIEGVSAQGTRTTETIPAEQIGNEFPIKVVDEVWYSPELRMTIMTTHNDPRTGEIVYKLTNISRANPSRSLFEPPPDYTIQTGPGPGGRGGRGTPGGRSMTPFGTKQ
jgi:hypothetical protein